MEARRGFWFGVGAYVLWGATPLFWSLVDDVGAIDLLANRILWSVPVLLLILAVQRRYSELRAAFSSARTAAATAVAATLLTVNWGVWLFAVTNERIVEASLGYFITPLVSVALGVIVLGERLRRLQVVAVTIAAIGVIGMTISVGSMPFIALALAFSFGVYGLVKKREEIPAPLISLMGEVATMAIPAAIVVFIFASPGSPRMSDGLGSAAFLIGTGLVTTIPLLMFGTATKRIMLSTLGLIQFIAPTLQLLIGVIVYGEDLALDRLVWFIVVWVAIGFFVTDLVSDASARKRSPAVFG